MDYWTLILKEEKIIAISHIWEILQQYQKNTLLLRIFREINLQQDLRGIMNLHRPHRPKKVLVNIRIFNLEFLRLQEKLDKVVKYFNFDFLWVHKKKWFDKIDCFNFDFTKKSYDISHLYLDFLLLELFLFYVLFFKFAKIKKPNLFFGLCGLWGLRLCIFLIPRFQNYSEIVQKISSNQRIKSGLDWFNIITKNSSNWRHCKINLMISFSRKIRQIKINHWFWFHRKFVKVEFT